MAAFHEWLDTFLSEKRFDLDEPFQVDGPSGPNQMTYQVVVEHLKIAPVQEQREIKSIMIQLDFKNRDIRHFMRHLAQAIAI
jgi:hypothetical protein